jgi:hypothetical protein
MWIVLLSYIFKYIQFLLLKEFFILILAKLITYDAIIIQVQDSFTKTKTQNWI